MNDEVKDIKFGDAELMTCPKAGVNPEHDYWDKCVNCGGGFANSKKKPSPTCLQCMPDYIVTRQDNPADGLQELLWELRSYIYDRIHFCSEVYELEAGLVISVDGDGELTFKVKQNALATFTISATNKNSLASALREIAADLEDWKGRVRRKGIEDWTKEHRIVK